MTPGLLWLLLFAAFLVACCAVIRRRNHRRHGCGRWTRHGRRGTLPPPSKDATRYATPGAMSARFHH